MRWSHFLYRKDGCYPFRRVLSSRGRSYGSRRPVKYKPAAFEEDLSCTRRNSRSSLTLNPVRHTFFCLFLNCKTSHWFSFDYVAVPTLQKPFFFFQKEIRQRVIRIVLPPKRKSILIRHQYGLFIYASNAVCSTCSYASFVIIIFSHDLRTACAIGWTISNRVVLSIRSCTVYRGVCSKTRVINPVVDCVEKKS